MANSQDDRTRLQSQLDILEDQTQRKKRSFNREKFKITFMGIKCITYTRWEIHGLENLHLMKIWVWYKLNMSQLIEGLLEFWPVLKSIGSKMQEVVILLYLTMTISGILCRIRDTLVPRGHCCPVSGFKLTHTNTDTQLLGENSNLLKTGQIKADKESNVNSKQLGKKVCLIGFTFK